MGTPALREIWFIRAGVGVLAMVVFSLTYLEFFERYAQEIIGALVLVAGLGLMAMIPLDSSPGAYVDGPVFFLLPIYVLFRLRFMYASIIGLLLVVIYCVILYSFDTMRGAELWAHALFVIASNSIGMVAGYALENYARKEFLQTMVIDEERQKNARLLQVKNRFFANISHEIRTPLTLILGPLEDLIEQGKSTNNSRKTHVLEIMWRNGQRLLSFLNQLLELSRLDVEQLPFEYKKAQIVTFLDHVVSSFQPYAEVEGVRLEFEFDKDDAECITDYEKLEVIVSNLLSNAIKYTQRGGHVKLRVVLRKDENVFEFTVKDNGPGIPKEELEHVFDRFYRADTPGNELVAGLGIGLSLTRALVNQMGGEIHVNSELNYGTAFTFVLPQSVQVQGDIEALDINNYQREQREVYVSREQRIEVNEQEVGSGFRLGTLLVIDDHPDVRAYIRDSLNDRFYVVESKDGRDGLERMKELVPDIVIVDVMMPELDGYSFLREMRADIGISHIPVVMLTASADQENRIAGLQAGADDYLTKPFNQAELSIRIENLIQRREMMKRAYSSLIDLNPDPIEVVSSERSFIEQVREVVNEQIGNEHFNVDALAAEVGVSVRQLQRKIRALTGETPASLIRSMRVKRAKQLLEGSFGTVAEIAYAVGFNNPAYFTKRFREMYGQTPTEWAALNGEGIDGK